ncbi:flavin reductase family protein [Neolewinella persica]|uniref:flavin reductase family protein n=1 Tax=Neolewinella persica TaxID=70998 RepID=UPI000364CCE6|nr:flavin reductase family protein [Neolewinella persica]
MIIDPKKVSTAELFGYLTTAVAPRPVCFASTIDKEGNVNLSPFSFFNVFSANPPMMVFSPSRRVRDGSTKHTLENVLEVPEVVINIVNYSIVEQMSLASTEYDKGVNEFDKAALTQVQSEVVRPPRVGESPVAFECKVDRVIALGEGPGAGNLILARVVMAHINEDYLGNDGKLDTRKLDLVARMGGNDYCRATPESLFEIPKPVLTKGVGIDQLPPHIRNSTILTGNNLGRLGNVERLPHPADVAKVVDSASYRKIKAQGPEAIHRLAQSHLNQGRTWEALCWLMGL